MTHLGLWSLLFGGFLAGLEHAADVRPGRVFFHDLVDTHCIQEGNCPQAASDGTQAVSDSAEETFLIQADLSVAHRSVAVAAPEFGVYDKEATTITTTPDPTGMTMNAVGDMAAFVAALISNSVSVVVFIGIFSVLRLRYPQMYSNNVLTGVVPIKPTDTTFGWYRPVMDLTIDEVTEHITLDHAMMLEFTHLAMKILAWVGIPMLLICGPLNCAFGGNAAGEDHLSYLSFGNVKNGSQLYWLHCFVVWYVVLTVKNEVWRAQDAFLPRRFKWLRNMSELRANTVMMESIPAEYQSEQTLREFWEKLLPHAKILNVYFAKDTDALQSLIAKCNQAKALFHQAEVEWTNSGNTERPTVRESFMGQRVDAMEHYQKQIDELEPQIKEERARIKEAAKTIGGVNSSSAFVTFKEKSDAELVLRLDGISPDQDLWELYSPPSPSDVLWADLTQDDSAQEVRTFLGYAFVVGLYFAYMPIVIGVTNIAKVINMGPLQPVWAGLAPTMGLQLMIAFLPTFLILIFSNFFTLRAAAWAQHKLQVWYYWFQIVFVILATAVGQNVAGFTKTLISEPFKIFGVLATTMPFATHFYMNFLVLDWVTHAMSMLRYVPLTKFKVAQRFYSDEEAAVKAEPEDQDYYGIGGRTARWAIIMTVGIVYGTLSPPINLLCFVDFAICRLVYGYLFVFAETKKPDLGGVYWVKMLEQLLVACVIYTILMTGVLFKRAAESGPGIIASGALIYSLFLNHRFQTAFTWDKLPFQELMESHDHKHRVETTTYTQPEMLDS